jgi:hypothetical protein
MRTERIVLSHLCVWAYPNLIHSGLLLKGCPVVELVNITDNHFIFVGSR